jgi:DNA-binding IclR family transcriptional regulator
MPVRELAITDESAQALIGDLELGGLWEQMRRTKRPMTAQELAEISRIDTGTVQRHLDRMEALALAERLPMSSRRKQQSHRVTTGDVVIRYRSPYDHAQVAEALANHSSHLRVIVG